MKFVDHIAEYLRQSELPLEQMTIIVPSDRMRRFLNSALFRAYKKPILAPEIKTIDRWVKDNTDLPIIDRTRVLLELYKVHTSKSTSEDEDSFDEFLSWGEMLLNDFNDIDRYLVDPSQLFKNLMDVKEIEQWSFNSERELTEGQKRFMAFWDKLPDYYSELNARLEKKGVIYAGAAYRQLTSNIDRLTTHKREKRKYLFVGFNALSAAELNLMKQLTNMGRAEVIFDADVFYLDQKHHEAGRFIRKNLRELELKPSIPNRLASKPMKVELVACAQNTGQVKVMTSELAKMSQDEVNKTLLLLADESLINPTLKNLPESVSKANISLGIPLRSTSLRTWVELIFDIQENFSRFNTTAFYHADILGLFRHPYLVKSVSNEEQKAIRKEEERIIRNNRVFVKPQSLQEKTSFILELLAVNWSGYWVIAIQNFRKLNAFLFSSMAKEDQLERAAIEHFDSALRDFENIAIQGLPEMSLRSFRHLFDQHWTRKSVAYHGNPETGLQVMGLLETRGLDFDNVICLGMNEGKLPPTNPIQTFIPMDLRRYFGLPLPRDKQGLFAHHFYRLLHEAKNVLITYSVAENDMGISEPSRYVIQLEKELFRSNPNIELTKKIYAVNTGSERAPVSVAKNEAVRRNMADLLSVSVSASMLKTYLTCPLDFYYKYVLKFEEAQEVKEEIEYSTFGTFIHDALEILYEPFARLDKNGDEIDRPHRQLTSFDVEKMLKDYPVILKELFLKHFNGDENAFMKGKNYLSFKMAMQLTERFLKAEINFISGLEEPLYIEALEAKFDHTIELKIAGKNQPVRFRGTIDRVDKIGEQYRIIDYKSGKVGRDDVRFMSKVQEGEDIYYRSIERKHVLQLIQYAYLFKENTGKVAQSAIISFVSGGFVPFILDTGKKYSYEDVIAQFPEVMNMLFDQMMDIEIPFKHIDRGKYTFCNYCE